MENTENRQISDGISIKCTDDGNKYVVVDDSVTNINFCSCSDIIGCDGFIVDENNPCCSNDEFGVLFNKDKTTLIKCLGWFKEKIYTIPESVTSIADDAFDWCDGLVSFSVDDNNSCYSCDEFGALFNKDKTILITYPYDNERTEYTVPDTVTSIHQDAFRCCKNLTSITIPDSVTSIGDWAFAYCLNLTSVRISNRVTSIGESVFECCYNLTSITIPENVTSIGEAAFAYCSSLAGVHIPDSVTSIGDYAFFNCVNISSVHIPDSVTDMGKWVFDSFESIGCREWALILERSNLKRSKGRLQPILLLDVTQ